MSPPPLISSFAESVLVVVFIIIIIITIIIIAIEIPPFLFALDFVIAWYTRFPLAVTREGSPADKALPPRSDAKTLGLPIGLDSRTEAVSVKAPTAPTDKASGPVPLPIVIPPNFGRRDTTRSARDLFEDGPAPTDTASAPTSPTYRRARGDDDDDDDSDHGRSRGRLGSNSGTATSSNSSSGDESHAPVASAKAAADSAAPKQAAEIDTDGFRVVRRRHQRRRSSGPRSLRPKVEAPVPNGFSAFALDEADEHEHGSGSDGESSPRSPTRGGKGRARRDRNSSPRRSTRQCAVGLFGGGSSSLSLEKHVSSGSRSRGSSRRQDDSQISISAPIRSVRSLPDLTYAAALATRAETIESGADSGGHDDEGLDYSPSPPRGSRGRRGAVKVVASSVGLGPLTPQPLLVPGTDGLRPQTPQMLLVPGMEGLRLLTPQPLLVPSIESLRRGPSYPPRADQILDETAIAQAMEADEAVDGVSSTGLLMDSTAASMASASTASHTRPPTAVRAKGGASGSGFGSPPPHTLRFRLLSNSSHLLMLSLELDMIKKQKISAPLKPRWGKHRANDFNPLPPTTVVPSAPCWLKCVRSSSSLASMSVSASAASASASGAVDTSCGPGSACCDPDTARAGDSSAPSPPPSPTSAYGEARLRDPSSRLRFSWSWADLPIPIPLSSSDSSPPPSPSPSTTAECGS
ncbi:hypothetical protein BCV70DRAFT_219469 [Testicularia cyperi]|uniref:Uncharacterized protein n=1 Tax=Testicularia cyperi TaxID=1882483 RepID=A0A317XGL6_9BASI|nr:hypothetical protein BCV70DRAFT_219469 [Testicularia cyperi]